MCRKGNCAAEGKSEGQGLYRKVILCLDLVKLDGFEGEMLGPELTLHNLRRLFCGHLHLNPQRREGGARLAHGEQDAIRHGLFAALK